MVTENMLACKSASMDILMTLQRIRGAQKHR